MRVRFKRTHPIFRKELSHILSKDLKVVDIDKAFAVCHVRVNAEKSDFSADPLSFRYFETVIQCRKMRTVHAVRILASRIRIDLYLQPDIIRWTVSILYFMRDITTICCTDR